MLNNVFGDDGVGLINLVTFAILTVFLVGMMIGPTEFLGKKIEACEMKLVMLAVAGSLAAKKTVRMARPGHAAHRDRFVHRLAGLRGSC